MTKQKEEQVTHVKQWLKLFEGSALYKHEPSRMFEDYLDLVLCCMSNQQQEERYLQVAKRYTRDELNTMAQLMAYHLMIHEHQVRVRARTDGTRGWYDMLGDIYMELAGRSKTSRMGQFFTPQELCTLMARMTMDDQVEQAEGKSICDPAAGSGRMLLAMHALQPKVSLVAAADLDPICAKMCALNFWLHGVRGEVACMNSLTLEWRWAYHTHPNPNWPFVTYLGEERKTESLLYTEAAQVLQRAQEKQRPSPAPDLFTLEDPQAQYGPLKAQYPGAVLLFRVPGSLLVLGEDVATVVRVMELSTPAAQVLRLPESWFDEVMPRLCRAGYRVALCKEPAPLYGPAARTRRYLDNDRRKTLEQLHDLMVVLQRHKAVPMTRGMKDWERVQEVNRAEKAFWDNRPKIELEMRLRGAELVHDSVKCRLVNAEVVFRAVNIGMVLEAAKRNMNLTA